MNREMADLAHRGVPAGTDAWETGDDVETNV